MMSSLTAEIKVRAPPSLLEQLKAEAEANEMKLSEYIRKKLVGSLKTNSKAPADLIGALSNFFELFQHLVSEDRIQLKDSDIEKLKKIQEVARKYV